MLKRGSRGYTALAVLLIVQLIVVVVYLWPWPGLRSDEVEIEPSAVAAVGPAAVVEGMPTIVDPADIDIPDAPPVPSGDLAVGRTAGGLSIEASLELGAMVSAEWAPGGELVGARMQIDWPQDGVPETVTVLSEFGWIYHYFVDTEGPVAATLIVTIERTQGQVTETAVDPLPILGEVVIDPATIEVWDTAATLAIEMLGGTAFRSACPTVRYTTAIQLGVDPASGNPVWTVEYPEAKPNGRSLIGRVDAVTGEATIVEPGASDC